MQLNAGNTATGAFLLAVVFVFLVLAAQYESWSLPLAVILVMPMCLLCSLVGVHLARMDVSLFTQIGFVVLVGLASKNAILIVEFAKQSQEAGVSRRESDRGMHGGGSGRSCDDIVLPSSSASCLWLLPRENYGAENAAVAANCSLRRDTRK